MTLSNNNPLSIEQILQHMNLCGRAHHIKITAEVREEGNVSTQGHKFSLQSLLSSLLLNHVYGYLQNVSVLAQRLVTENATAAIVKLFLLATGTRLIP